MNAKKPLFEILIQQASLFSKEHGYPPRAFILPEGSIAILERELMNTSIVLTTSPISGKALAIFCGIPIFEDQDIVKLLYDF